MENPMDDAHLGKILLYLKTEEDLPERFGLSDEAFLPLFFSLRFGGAWCYASSAMKTIAIVKKTTVYDDTTRTGHTLEELFLFVNPELVAREGTVCRLEKCGEENERLRVERPFKVGIASERVIKMTVNPQSMQISTIELPAERRDFEGSTAFAIAHEMEHLEETTIQGKNLWEFRFL
jgi:predicted metalloprotease